MVEKKSVIVNWQILFAIIPVINLWACYRIEKLRLYLLVIIAILVVEFLITQATLDEQDFECYWGLIECEMNDRITYLISVLLVIEAGISIVLIRMWSKEWNSKITKNS